MPALAISVCVLNLFSPLFPLILPLGQVHKIIFFCPVLLFALFFDFFRKYLFFHFSPFSPLDKIARAPFSRAPPAFRRIRAESLERMLHSAHPAVAHRINNATSFFLSCANLSSIIAPILSTMLTLSASTSFWILSIIRPVFSSFFSSFSLSRG